MNVGQTIAAWCFAGAAVVSCAAIVQWCVGRNRDRAGGMSEADRDPTLDPWRLYPATWWGEYGPGLAMLLLASVCASALIAACSMSGCSRIDQARPVKAAPLAPCGADDDCRGGACRFPNGAK